MIISYKCVLSEAYVVSLLKEDMQKIKGKIDMGDKIKRIQRVFPEYFELFEMPKEAREEELKVYRACRTGKCDRLSFLPTYEEQGFRYFENDDPTDPGIYSLSTYEKPKDVKRFAKLNSDFEVPFKIAVGYTKATHGLVQRTRERIRTQKNSHVDWWLYKDSTPYEEFELIADFEEYYEKWKNKGVK